MYSETGEMSGIFYRMGADAPIREPEGLVGDGFFTRQNQDFAFISGHFIVAVG